MRASLFLTLVLLAAVPLNAAEEKRPAPIVTLTPDLSPPPVTTDSIAAKIIGGDYVEEGDAWIISSNRAKVAKAIAAAKPEAQGDRQAGRRAEIWTRALLPSEEKETAPPTLEDLRIAAGIAETMAVARGLESPYSPETLANLISGGDPLLAGDALRNVELFRLRECLPVIRETFPNCPINLVADFARVLAALDPNMNDVRVLLSRINAAESTQDQIALLETVSFWFVPEITVEAMAAVESKILTDPKLQKAPEILSLWAMIATDRSLPALKAAAETSDAEILWYAIARVSPRADLPKVFRAFPKSYSPLVLLRGAYFTLRNDPMPELAPVVMGFLAETNLGIARLPLSSIVIDFLLNCCGAEGLIAAGKLAETAGEPRFARAVKWKREGFTLEGFARELSAAGVIPAEELPEVKEFVEKAKVREGDTVLESDLIVPFLESKKIAVRVPLQDESMPVEYPRVVNLFGNLKSPQFLVVETDQQVDGIEQLASVNPETLEVPADVKLRYKVVVHTLAAKVELRPLDLRDWFDMEGLLEAFNGVSEKLELPGRFEVVSKSGNEAVVVYGDTSALKRILAAYGEDF